MNSSNPDWKAMAGLDVEVSKPPTTGMQNHRGENQSGIVSDDDNHKM